MKNSLAPLDLHFVSLNTSLICYVPSLVVPDSVVVSMHCLTRKQGDVALSPVQGNIPIFSVEFLEKEKIAAVCLYTDCFPSSKNLYINY